MPFSQQGRLPLIFHLNKQSDTSIQARIDMKSIPDMNLFEILSEVKDEKMTEVLQYCFTYLQHIIKVNRANGSNLGSCVGD